MLAALTKGSASKEDYIGEDITGFGVDVAGGADRMTNRASAIVEGAIIEAGDAEANGRALQNTDVDAAVEGGDGEDAIIGRQDDTTDANDAPGGRTGSPQLDIEAPAGAGRGGQKMDVTPKGATVEECEDVVGGGLGEKPALATCEDNADSLTIAGHRKGNDTGFQGFVEPLKAVERPFDRRALLPGADSDCSNPKAAFAVDKTRNDDEIACAEGRCLSRDVVVEDNAVAVEAHGHIAEIGGDNDVGSRVLRDFTDDTFDLDDIAGFEDLRGGSFDVA